MKKYIYLATTIFATILLLQPAQADFPQELGKVKWQRNFATALQQAKEEDKPLMVLFDEVPGCSTCVNFGQGPLQHFRKH